MHDIMHLECISRFLKIEMIKFQLCNWVRANRLLCHNNQMCDVRNNLGEELPVFLELPYRTTPVLYQVQPVWRLAVPGPRLGRSGLRSAWLLELSSWPTRQRFAPISS